jgi:hypothetical protein
MTDTVTQPTPPVTQPSSATRYYGIVTRPFRVDGDVAYITLTKECAAIIDVCDLHLVKNFNWHVNKAGGVLYAARNSYKNKTHKKILMHRVILDMKFGEMIDHINGNGLDNRRCNLRAATKSENAQNQGLSSKNTSGYKGVTFHKKDKKWYARICLNKKSKYLGSFETAQSANLAYQLASKELHANFRRQL